MKLTKEEILAISLGLIFIVCICCLIVAVNTDRRLGIAIGYLINETDRHQEHLEQLNHSVTNLEKTVDRNKQEIKEIRR